MKENNRGEASPKTIDRRTFLRESAVAAVSLGFRLPRTQETLPTIENYNQYIEVTDLSALQTQGEVDEFVHNYNVFLQHRVTGTPGYLDPQTVYYSLAFTKDDYDNFAQRSGLGMGLVEFIQKQDLLLTTMIQKANEGLYKLNFTEQQKTTEIMCRRVVILQKDLGADGFYDDDGTHRIADGYHGIDSAYLRPDLGVDLGLMHEAFHCHTADLYAINLNWSTDFLNNLRTRGIQIPNEPHVLNNIPDAWKIYDTQYGPIGPDIMSSSVDQFCVWTAAHLATKIKERRLHNKQILYETNWNFPARMGKDIPNVVCLDVGAQYAGQQIEIYRTNNFRLNEESDLKDFIQVHSGNITPEGTFSASDIFEWAKGDTNKYGVPSGESLLLIKVGDKFQYIDIRILNLAAWAGFNQSARIKFNLFDNQTPPPNKIKPQDYGIQISAGPELKYKANLPSVKK